MLIRVSKKYVMKMDGHMKNTQLPQLMDISSISTEYQVSLLTLYHIQRNQLYYFNMVLNQMLLNGFSTHLSFLQLLFWLRMGMMSGWETIEAVHTV
jgi:hypothetical protein